jgi:hypothetical protein
LELALAWMCGTADDSAFSCRIQSPVVWRELDCNDYGKELLRRHLLTSPHH